jgi:predicted enzyme related to lactoylglutathione lyase
MNHFTVLARDLEATKDFYLGVLGLTDGYRPNLGFPGAWLYAGNTAVLHIIAGRELPADPQGVLDHMAFSANDLPWVVRRSKARGLTMICAARESRGCGSCFVSTLMVRGWSWTSMPAKRHREEIQVGTAISFSGYRCLTARYLRSSRVVVDGFDRRLARKPAPMPFLATRRSLSF